MSSSKFLIKFFPFVKIIVPLTQWVGIWWSGCIFDCTYCMYLSCFLFTGTSLLSTYTLKASVDFVHQFNLSSTKWIRSAKSSSLADFSEWTRHFCSTFLLCAYLDWTISNTSFLVYQWHSWCGQQVVLSHFLRKLWSFGICCTISLFDVHICIDLFSVNCYDTK